MNEQRLKKIILFSLIVSVLLVLSGCGENYKTRYRIKAKGNFPTNVTDIYGSDIYIEKKPERIVALAPSIVEILYKLEIGDKIVGITDYCDYPIEAKEKTKVGSFNGVNIEKILELKPDIVFAGAGMSKEVYQRITNLNINVVVAEARELWQIPDTFLIIGEATGTFDKAFKLHEEVETRVNNIRDKAKGLSKVKTYYAISYGKQGNWTCGTGTFISDLIGIAGGENIADDVENWREYSIEKIIEKNPDLILLSATASSGNKDILDRETGYNVTNAVRNDNVVIIDDTLTQRPGPRIVEGLELIARAIHPEVFGIAK